MSSTESKPQTGVEPDRTLYPHPIFVGGSARAGTHAMGRLIAADPRYHLVDVEARFHCATGGLTDLLDGKGSVDDFLRRCRQQWYRRGLQNHVGLQKVIAEDSFEAALAPFPADFEADPWAACRKLTHALLDPGASAEGKPAWVEVSGSNIRSAPTLLRLLPDARFVHMVRDGRAVTAAILRKRDMTDDVQRAFGHWETRVKRSDEALRTLPEGHALTVFLDDLTAHDRDNTFDRLASFLELDDPAPMRSYFDNKISSERAHVGKWRERISPADARWVDRRYRRLVRELRRDGVDWVPEPERQESTVERFAERAGEPVARLAEKARELRSR